MDWEMLRERLESILKKDVTMLAKPLPSGAAIERADDKFIFAAPQGIRYIVHGTITPTEEQLISLLIESCHTQGTKRPADHAIHEEERQAALLSAWVMERLEEGELEAELPDSMAAWPSLGNAKIPILLYGEYPERQQFGELRKLLQSFFDTDVTIIPLHNKMWFILEDENLLNGSDEESLEDMLREFASGLQEMFASEWVGDCHVAVTYPIHPAKQLISTIVTLREVVDIGRRYRFSSNIHVPWELRLEALLDKAPDQAKRRLVDGVFKGMEAALDAELITTLDTFFAEDCNVSDTAKMLYIHRNTLLYRLDKFKQETGLDVRMFDHAVLVKLALILYKVTKRK
jgi:sugar diacid utilization regulator